MFFQGQVLREVSAVTTRQGTPVTALCHDEFCNVLISGDQSKYFFEKKIYVLWFYCEKKV